MRRSQKCKKTDKLTVFFALLESALVKAACKRLMKLTPPAGLRENSLILFGPNNQVVSDNA